MFSSGLHLS